MVRLRDCLAADDHREAMTKRRSDVDIKSNSATGDFGKLLAD
jgi:hypothetical protein